jgi:hypothetical protein
VRYKVIVLHPHRLKGCMLLKIASTPNLQVRIKATKSLTDLGAYHRNAAEPAMVAVSLMESEL